jgi:hypothetical protein
MISAMPKHGTPKVSAAKLGHFINAAIFNPDLIINKLCNRAVDG